MSPPFLIPLLLFSLGIAQFRFFYQALIVAFVSPYIYTFTEFMIVILFTCAGILYTSIRRAAE
jgi:hypothetical protein